MIWLGLMNETNDLFKGLIFESKANLQYVVKCYSINRNQHMIVIESEPDMWVVKCKKWYERCNWRLRACHRKTQFILDNKVHRCSHLCLS